MSKRRKPSHTDKMRKRTTTRQIVNTELPSPEAVQAYVETFEWAEQNPEAADAVLAFTGDQVHANVIGIAYSERMPGTSEDEILMVADLIKTWHILSGFKYFYDWWDIPIAQMSPEDIVAQIRLDRTEGRLSAPTDDDGNPIVTAADEARAAHPNG